MRTLLIETSTERGVIAYGNEKEIFFSKELPFGLNQSKYLMPYLRESLTPFGSPPPLDLIGVGVGPGSYTGIRLGVAAAQTLAYSWNLPLVGVCSLEGFIPSDSSFVSYAAILDARIGGVYLQKGWKNKEGQVQKTVPCVFSLEEAAKLLEGVEDLVTPYSKSLQIKLDFHPLSKKWRWEERAPCAFSLLQKIDQYYTEGKFVHPPTQLELLYLRETEAERNKKSASISK